MRPRNVILVAVGILLAAAGVFTGTHPADIQGWFGFSKADYFTYGTIYAFCSGIGPMLLTGLGMSTIIVGLWHNVNCHEAGCYKIGRHKVDGTPWCNSHHENARLDRSDHQLFKDMLAELQKLNKILTGEAE